MTLGSDATDIVTFNGHIQGQCVRAGCVHCGILLSNRAHDRKMAFEGLTSNDFHVNFSVTDPSSADRVITFPDTSGEVLITAGLSNGRVPYIASSAMTTSGQIR